MLVEIDAPGFGQLDLAADAVVAVLDDDRAAAVAERREELGEPLGVGAAVAREAQRLRVALADRGEVVDGLGDDAQALHLAVVGHALLHLGLDDDELVLAQQVRAASNVSL